MLESLRATPNMFVWRPADTNECSAAYIASITNTRAPSVLALSRQNLPQLRTEAGMLSAKGAYRLRAAEAPRKVVIIATGSEVAIACDVRDALEAQGIGADVVSMPSWSRFKAMDAAYRADILPAGALRVSIEAGTTFGWEAITGLDGLRFGVDSFGASAPAEVLYDHFGLTPAKIAPQIVAALA